MIGSDDHLVLHNLLHREDFVRRVHPYLKEEYFRERSDQVVFRAFSEYFERYNCVPSTDALMIDVSRVMDLSDDEFEAAERLATCPRPDASTSLEWLVDRAEEFCKDRALKNALREANRIALDPDSKVGKGVIPQMLMDALGVSFDADVGLDYFEDAEGQWEWMHRDQPRLPFHIDLMNKATRGGVPADTGWLGIFLAGTNVGKSLTLCDYAANHLMMGYDVLYVSLEMDERQIVERIDANMLDIQVNDLSFVSRDTYLSRKREIGSKTRGRLVVKQFPGGGGTSIIHIERFLNELLHKKKFRPKIIYLDYLGELSSTRVKMGESSYNFMGAVTGEVRGFSIKHKIPVMTAVQTNRSGFESSELSMTNVAESFAIPQKADLMIGLFQSEAMVRMRQMMHFLLKSRLGDKSKYSKFVVGIDVPKMKYFDLDEGEGQDIVDVEHDPETGEILEDNSIQFA